MRDLSEKGSTFSKTATVLVIVGLLAGYGIYLSQKALNNISADDILNGVWEHAKQEKTRIDPKESEEDDEEEEHLYVRQTERKGYGFSIAAGSTPTLIKVDTEKKAISPGVCRALKKKFKESMWWDAFAKVVVVDRMGDEKTDVSIYDCPREKIPTLRFYVKFAESNETETVATEGEEETTEQIAFPAPAPALPAPTPAPRAPASVPSSSYKRTTCPAGTSSSGLGGMATSGCRCNRSGETWNGSRCEAKGCPSGSSKEASGSGDDTNVLGCRCNEKTPHWSETKGICIQPCTGGKVLYKGECICPENKVQKEDNENLCVDCNENSDCPSGQKCLQNKCIQNEETDCRWGICQTCTKNGARQNIQGDQGCEVAGLAGRCNNNGTCYPIRGHRCSSVRGCPEGEFCNYGGTFSSSKKQKGKFGQTPNVCQVVDAQKFTYKDVTYYYNTEKDLKAWCRAANNKPNCLWGYLAKAGANSWCASLGKRLLTKEEMASVWDVLRKKLPPTYKGYAYWIQEGVWIEDRTGRLGFSKGHADGYGGRGGVVCR